MDLLNYTCAFCYYILIIKPRSKYIIIIFHIIINSNSVRSHLLMLTQSCINVIDSLMFGLVIKFIDRDTESSKNVSIFVELINKAKICTELLLNYSINNMLSYNHMYKLLSISLLYKIFKITYVLEKSVLCISESQYIRNIQHHINFSYKHMKIQAIL